MEFTPSLKLINEITDFLARNPSPEEIVAFKPSDTLAQRALDLLARNRENNLTIEERHEMQEFMFMDHFMTLLKAKSRLKIS
jgi:hypothetical protein